MSDALKDAEAALAGLGKPAAPPAKPTSVTAKIPEGEIVFTGVVGGHFNVDGNGFGPSSSAANFVAPGSVLVNDRSVTITRWKDTSIKGVLPDDIEYGPVVVQCRGKKWNGYFGPKPADKK